MKQGSVVKANLGARFLARENPLQRHKNTSLHGTGPNQCRIQKSWQVSGEAPARISLIHSEERTPKLPSLFAYEYINNCSTAYFTLYDLPQSEGITNTVNLFF